MLKLFPLIFKNMRMSRVRTILTIGGVGVAIFIFCFFGAIQDNLDQMLTNAGAHNNLVIFQKNQW